MPTRTHAGNPAAPPRPAATPLRFRLALFIVGTTPSSARAIVNVRRLCERHLPGRYDLEVIDLSLNPRAAAKHQLVAAPTLVKDWPPPVRRFIGDMSDTARLLRGLGLPAAEPA